MNPTFRLALVLLLAAPAAASAQTRPTLIRGVTIIDGTGAAPVPGQSVLVRDGRIERIGPVASLRAPAGAETVDGRNRWLIPGLFDVHAHVTMGPVHGMAAGKPRVEPDPAAVTTSLRHLLGYGITTIRDPGAAPTAHAVGIRDSLARGQLVGPRMMTAGEIIDRTAFPGLVVTVTSPEEVRAEVRRQAALGVDWIKLYASLDSASVVAGIEEAHAHGKKAVGHLFATSWTQAANAGIDGLVHSVPSSPRLLAPAKRAEFVRNIARNTRFMLQWFEYYEPASAESDSMIAALVRHRVAHDPTLVVFEAMAFGDQARITRSDDLRMAPPSLLANWRSEGFGLDGGFKPEDYRAAQADWPLVLRFVKQLHDRGVLLMAGSDANNPWVAPGPSLHRELELLVAAGISPLEVLRIATLNSAKGLGLDDRLGTIATAKVADLLLLDGDPTADIRNTRRIAWVMQNGRRIAPGELTGR